MKPNKNAVDIGVVVAAELDDIANRRGDADAAPAVAANWQQECHNRRLFGMCLSGGGIRSATFSLGVLQGLAERGLLPKADYLSTVSGGGYIGSWLQGVLWRQNAGPQGFDVLKARVPGPPNTDPISFLRKYSDYLSPRSGLSLDAVVIPLIWLRNALLNQAIFISAFLAAFLVLLFPTALVRRVSEADPHGCTIWALLILAAALGITVVYWIGKNLTAIVRREHDPNAKPLFPPGEGTARVSVRIVLPLFVGAVLVVLSLVPAKTVLASHRGQWFGFFALWALLATLQWGGGFIECWTEQRRASNGDLGGLAKAVNWLVPRLHVLWMTAACAGLIFGLFRALYALTSFWACRQSYPNVVAWLPPLYLIALTLGVGLQIGLMGRDFPDSSREWLARVGALSWVVAFGWAAAFAIGVFSPLWAAKIWQWKRAAIISGVTGWAATTISSVLAGKSGKTGEAAKENPGFSVGLDAVARYGPFIAVPGFLILAASSLHWLLHFIGGRYLPDVFAAGSSALQNFIDSYWDGLPYDVERWEFLLLVLAVLTVVFVVLSLRVNINEFSMHHFYKNRLVRCFLGASAAKKRQPDSFTGFDAQDDLPLSSLQCTGLGTAVSPYPILNATVTVTVGSELATQERKAVPWFFAPRYSGFHLEESAANIAAAARGIPEAAFVPTGEILGGGLHLGTAMAVSGAALNPSSGYHFAPQTAFLMTLFDVRLGWWIGNPLDGVAYRKTGPAFALFCLLRELFGFVSERSAYLNLSDGGNFENLGLYELVRRRCRYIIAVDGEEDPSYSFESLGGAVRKCREDFGVEIDIDARPIVPDRGKSSTHCVVGKIYYPDPDGAVPGWLLYIKSSVVGDEPGDVEQYRRQHADFPQQPTTEQFFLESQFESYRRLGLHIARTTFNPFMPGTDLDDTFTRLENRWTKPPAAPEGAVAQHAAAYVHLVERLADSPSLATVDGEFVEPFPLGHQPSREATLFRIELLQLMETVFFDLGLGNSHSWHHPANAGWKKVYEYWTAQPSMKDLWEIQKLNYSKPFQDFLNHLIARSDGPPPWQAV